MLLQFRKLQLPVFLLFLTIPAAFAQTANYSADEFSPLPCILPADYPSFWESTDWWYYNPNVIRFSGGDLYAAPLQQTQVSLGADSWQLEDDATLQMKIGEGEGTAESTRALTAALSSAKKAKAAYESESETYRKLADQISVNRQISESSWAYQWFFKHNVPPEFSWVYDASIPFTYNIYRLFGIVDFEMYARAWKNSTRAGLDALSSSSTAINSAYSSAQSEAYSLWMMGAGRHAGQSATAYRNWSIFANEILPYCGTGKYSQEPNIAKASGRYSAALVAAKDLQQKTLFPAYVLKFGENYGANAYGPKTLLSLAIGYRDASVWADAWKMRAMLSDTAKKMRQEYDEVENIAESEISKSNEALGGISKNSPDAFSDYFKLAKPASRFAESLTTGSPSERMAALKQRQADAEILHASASSLSKQTSIQGYLADAASMQRQAASGAVQAAAEAKKVLATMEEYSNSAENDAEAKIGLLKNALAGSQTSTPQQQAAYKSASALLSEAENEFGEGRSTFSQGVKYSHFRKSALKAESGMAMLGKEDSSSEAFDYNISLSNARRLVAALKASCPQSESSKIERDVQWADSQFRLLPLSAAPEKIQISQGLEDAAKSLLDECFMPLNLRYAALQRKAKSLAQFDMQLSNSFSTAFWPYRSSAGWTDKAYSSYAQVNSLLSSWEDRLLNGEIDGVKQILCLNSKYSEEGKLVPKAGVASKSTLSWSTKNDYSEIAYPFTLSCQVASDAEFASAASLPEYVRAASISRGRITINFKMLPDGEKAGIVFEAESTPVTFAPGSSSATLDPQGKLLWQRNFTLSSTSDFARAILDLPMPQMLGMPALSSSGRGMQQGETASDGLQTYAHFELAGVKKGSQQLTLSAQGSPAVRFGAESVLQDAAGATVQKTIAISSLPQSDYLDISFSDPMAVEVTNADVSSEPDGLIRKIDKKSGSPIFRIFVSPAPADGILGIKISYPLSDISRSISDRILALQARVEKSASPALASILASAKKAAGEGRFTDASVALQKIENEFAILGEGESLAALLEKDRRSARDLLAVLAPSANQSFEGSTLGKKMLETSAELSRALASSEGKALEGDSKSARATLSAAIGKALSSISSDSQGEALAMQKRLVQLKENATMVGNVGGEFPSILSSAETKLQTAKNAILSGANMSEIVANLAEADLLLNDASAKLSNAGKLEALSLKSDLEWLAKESDVFGARAAAYTSALARINAAKSYYTPILDAQGANSLLSSLKSALSSASSAAKDDGSAKSIESLRQKLAQANITLQDSIARLGEAENHLASHSSSKVRLAQAAVEALPEDAPLSAQLKSDLLASQNFQANGNYADAIASAEKIIQKATPSLPVQPQSSPPYLLIVATLALAAGLAYIFFFRKPPEEKLAGEKKKLNTETESPSSSDA